MITPANKYTLPADRDFCSCRTGALITIYVEVGETVRNWAGSLVDVVVNAAEVAVSSGSPGVELAAPKFVGVGE